MKRLSVFFSLVVCLPLYAQTVSVTSKEEKIKGESASGYTTELEGSRELVEASWNKFVKELGKVKSGSAYQYVENPVVGGTAYTTGILYATVQGNEKSARVWLGLKAAEWTVNDINIIQKQLEKLVYQFGVKFYRDQIQKQIDESQQALEAVLRQQQRLVNQQRDLGIQLDNNEKERINLEKSIETNKLEKLVVGQRIENNKKSQDSVKAAGEQIKKVILLHKERQRKVN